MEQRRRSKHKRNMNYKIVYAPGLTKKKAESRDNSLTLAGEATGSGKKKAMGRANSTTEISSI